MVDYSIAAESGLDFSQTYSVTTSTPEYPGTPVALGTQAWGTNGSMYMFVLASSAITQYACVSIDPNFNASMATNTSLLTYPDVGFAQVAIPSGQYGWVAMRGTKISVLSKGAVAKTTPLYISSSAGILVTTTSSFALVTGIVTSTSYASTSTIGRAANASWPRSKQ